MEPIRMPGCRSSGGVDAMLAPRSEQQQRVLSGKIAEAEGIFPPGITETSEKIRRIPIVGEAILKAYRKKVITKHNS